MMKEDKDKEVVAPQESVEATQETNTDVNPYAGWISSMGDTFAQQKAEKDAAEARYKEAIDKLHNARANNRSAMYALLEEQKPTYDYDREKRERNKATIKALGDVLSAVTAGAHAYGKNGAGVVPTLAENSPLTEIEKINTMQEQYRKQNEAWKALDINWRAQEEEAKVKAAEAMATAAGKDLETAIKDVDDARDTITKGLLDIGNAEYKNANANARWAASEEGRERRHREKLASGDRSKVNKKKDALSVNEKGALMRMYSDYGIKSVSTTKSPMEDIAGNLTDQTKETTTEKMRYMQEFSAQDWENFAAANNAVITLMRNAKKNEGLSEDEVADLMLGVNNVKWNEITKLYNNPANKYTLATVIDYVFSDSDGK